MEKFNILWIEDEADKIMGLVRPLVKLGHNVVVANDKKDALGKIKDPQLDLIILDIIIPEGDEVLKMEIEQYVGIGVLKQIRKVNVNIPIIVLSLVNDKDTLNEIESYGVTKILPKGAFLPSDLKKEVYDTLGIKE